VLVDQVRLRLLDRALLQEHHRPVVLHYWLMLSDIHSLVCTVINLAKCVKNGH